jgi:hypothetical protein
MLHREEAEGEEELPPPPPPCPPPTTIIILGGFGSRGTPYDFSIILLPLLAVFGLLLLLVGFTSCFITRFFRGEAAAAATTGGAGRMATGAGWASATAGKIGLSRVERLLSQEVFGRRLSLGPPVGGVSVSFSTGGTPAGLLLDTSPKTMPGVSICGLCGRWEAGPDASEASTLAGRTGGVMCFSPAVRITDAAAVFCG